MIELAFCILADFEYDGIEPVANPSDGAILNREIGTLVEVVRMKEDLLCFLESDYASGIPAKALALPLIELESHEV